MLPLNVASEAVFCPVTSVDFLDSVFRVCKWSDFSVIQISESDARLNSDQVRSYIWGLYTNVHRVCIEYSPQSLAFIINKKMHHKPSSLTVQHGYIVALIINQINVIN